MLKQLFLSIFLLFGIVSGAQALEVETGQGTRNVVIADGLAFPINLAKICKQSRFDLGDMSAKIGRADGGYVTIGGVVTLIRCVSTSGGGGNTSVSASSHTGESAEEVAERVYDLPPSAVTTIDPGPVVSHSGVNDTNNNGSSQDEAEAATARGVTQDKTQPSAGTPGDTTNGGNNGVSIF